MRRTLSVPAALGLAVLASPVSAGTLSVAPLTLNISAPGSTGKLTVRNGGDKPVAVQVRVFRWSQAQGSDRLEPTRDVIASPPIAKIASGGEQLIRIVRVAAMPVSGEESYRLLLDELPDPARKRNGTVTLVLRYSLPVFFVAADAKPPRLSWRIGERQPLRLSASNSGQKHLRISNLKLAAGRGETEQLSAGLVGYVLGGSTMSFAFSQASFPAGPGNETRILGNSQDGPFDAAVAPGADR